MNWWNFLPSHLAEIDTGLDVRAIKTPTGHSLFCRISDPRGGRFFLVQRHDESRDAFEVRSEKVRTLLLFGSRTSNVPELALLAFKTAARHIAEGCQSPPWGP